MSHSGLSKSNAKHPKKHEQNRALRLTLDGKARLFFDFNPWKLQFPARLVNVSKTGALIQAKNPSPRLETLFEAEPICKLQLDPSDPNCDSFLATVRVVRSHKQGDAWFIGFSFAETTDTSGLDAWMEILESSQNNGGLKH